MSDIRNVICTHGIYSHSIGMMLIKRRLEREYGMRVFRFNYKSLRGTLDENATALAEFIHKQGLESTHIIGHSLGGVIALRMLANDPDAVPGRLVCLGSPLCGSRAASFMNERQWAEPMVGHSLKAGVLQAAANEWGSHVCETREIGVIAGTVPIGIGMLYAKFEGPNDGTIAVSETRLEGAKDHLVLDVSHKGLLVSKDVVDQTAAFLKRGEFLREDL